MFDIGWSELLIIAVVAIIVVGPRDLPGMLRSIGRLVGQLKRMASEFTRQFDEALRESELSELQKGVREATQGDPLKDFERSIDESIEKEKKAAAAEGREVEDVDDPGAVSENAANGSASSDGPAGASPESGRGRVADVARSATGESATTTEAERKGAVAERAAESLKAAGEDSGTT